MLAETNANPAAAEAPEAPEKKSQTSPTSPTANVDKASVSSKFAGLQMKDEEEECLNCGA